MNRLVCTNLDAIDPASLPAPRREPGAPARALFLHALKLGFGTTTRNITAAAATRDDLDAVHCNLRITGLPDLIGNRIPDRLGRWTFSGLRQMHAWRMVLRPLIGRGERSVFPLDRFDVVHIMTVQRALLLTALAGRPGPRFVVNIDATTVAFDRAFEIRTSAPRPEIAVERRIFHAADAVACASRWVLESVRDDYGVPEDRLFLHMPCVPAIATAPRTPDPGRPVRLVFVGNDWPRKGGPRLLRWHQQRWADRAELHVCSARAPVDRSARNVVWHGATPHDKLVREVLPAMDLFVMPTWEDTFLIAAQEAQAAALPVVTSRLAGIPEVVADGVSGILCDRADDDAFIRAIERLIDDPIERERLSRGALARAARDLDAAMWHNHLLDQLVALADGRPLRTVPAALDATPGAAPA